MNELRPISAPFSVSIRGRRSEQLKSYHSFSKIKLLPNPGRHAVSHFSLKLEYQRSKFGRNKICHILYFGGKIIHNFLLLMTKKNSDYSWVCRAVLISSHKWLLLQPDINIKHTNYTTWQLIPPIFPPNFNTLTI